MVSGEWRTTHRSPFTIHHSPLPTHHSLLTLHHSPLTIRYFLCRSQPSEAPQPDGAEQAVAGSIAARAAAAREPGRGAAAGKQIGDRSAVRPQHAAVIIDHQPALRMEQARHDAADV